MSSRDLLVVGGGPAGLAVAIRARQRDIPVTVIDARQPPIDKACGEGLMPDGVALLRQLDVELAPHERRDFVGIRYLDGATRAEARFPTQPGWGVRRRTLHRAMVRRAEDCGVDLRWGVTATGYTNGVVETRGGSFEARYVVAADGLRSPMRRLAGLEGASAKRRRFGHRRHYRLAPWSEHVEVYWQEGCEAYVTPVAEDEVGIAVLADDPARAEGPWLDRFPALAERVTHAECVSQSRGAGPLHQRAKRACSDRLALVGDAGGYLDAITGEGLSVAFHQAFAVVDAIEAGDLSRYARDHRRILRLPDAMTGLLLAIERRPWLRRRVVSALAAEPEVFARFLAVHAREAAPTSIGAGGLARLVRRILSGSPASGSRSVARPVA